MGTYIIHFDDKPWEDLDDELYYRCFEIPWFSTTKTTISRLTPYTEDSAYAHGYTEAESKYREIRDELEKQAYQRGYEGAYDTAYADAEEIYESGKRAMYQKGLKDAWEAARKIGCFEIDGGYPTTQMLDLFNRDDLPQILSDYTASEAIAKIRQYEQEKEEIHLGDEVTFLPNNAKGIVSECHVPDVYSDNDKYAVWCGGTMEYVLKQHLTKTGRTFPEIAAVLEKMKETDNG